MTSTTLSAFGLGTHSILALFFAVAVLVAWTTEAQPDPQWKVHDAARPQPPGVNPGTPSTLDRPGQAPSDAIVLFDGRDLSAWCSLDGSPAKWVVRDGAMECVKDSGYIRTLQNFGDCQLHIEWAAPVPPQGQSQGRGNSGVFLMGLYEVQVLDSFNNRTYADGAAGAVYGQYPPLVNPTRPPGQWQSYDIIFTRPRFDAQGKLLSPAYLTVLFNGVLVQNHVALTGPTAWMTREPYRPHPDKLPLALQDHGNPVRFRNVWVRDLEGGPAEFTFGTELLDRYVGTYEVDDRFSIIVTRQDTQLHMRLVHPTRQHAYPLFANSKTRFFAKTVDAAIEFQTAPDGSATGLTFYISGEARPARRVR